MSTPRFTEAEVRAIFERAAEKQEATRRAEETLHGGLSLEELQEIGTAAGISPLHVAEAAAEVQAGAGAQAPETLLGMPVSVRRTRYVTAPVGDAAWERMVADLRSHFGDAGIAGEVGKTREWTTAPGGRRSTAPVRVTVEPEGTGSRVTVEQTLRRSALPFALVGAAYSAVALVFGVLLAAGALGSGGAFMPALFAAMALVMFGGAQVGFRLYTRRQERRFGEALEKLERIARDATPLPEADAATPSAEPAMRPLLDLDGLPEPVREPTARTARRARS